jgi:hypothetical protein
MTHRQPTQIRECIPERSNKTADEIRNDLRVIKLAYAHRRNENQPRQTRMVGFAMVSLLCAFIAGLILTAWAIL